MKKFIFIAILTLTSALAQAKTVLLNCNDNSVKISISSTSDLELNPVTHYEENVYSIIYQQSTAGGNYGESFGVTLNERNNQLQAYDNGHVKFSIAFDVTSPTSQVNDEYDVATHFSGNNNIECNIVEKKRY